MSSNERDPFEEYEKKRSTKKKSGGKKNTKRSRKKKKKGCWWAWPVTILMVCVLSFLGMKAYNEMRSYDEFVQMRDMVDVSGFYNGINIEGTNVSGYSLDDVLSALGSYEDQLKANTCVTLKCGDKEWHITADELDYTTDFSDVVYSAWSIGHEGTLSQRYKAINTLKENGSAFAVTRTYDDTLLRAITDMAAYELTTPSQNAYVSGFDVQTRSFSYEYEKDGTYVDAIRLYNDAKAAIDSGTGDKVIEIVQMPVKPTLTVEEIKPQMGLAAEARTDAKGAGDRRDNIELALNTVSGMCVMPGEIFSVNDTLGERTAEKGYKIAGVYINGASGQEYGGGICQFSTTLFNAVAKVYPGLDIVKRSCHSRPVDYVDYGKDAAVSFPAQDFSFQNNTGFPVYIVAYLEPDNRNWVHISLYGKMLEDGNYVTLETRNGEVLHPGKPIEKFKYGLAKGEKVLVTGERDGYYAECYRVFHNAAGDVTGDMLLCRSTYEAQSAVYHVGP